MKALFYPEVEFASLRVTDILYEIYGYQIYVFLDGRKDLTVLDIGANIGLVTDHIRRYAKKVYAIEPSPMEFECLKRNSEFNKWHNVEVFNLAISTEDGEAEFHVNSINRTASTLKYGGRIGEKTGDPEAANKETVRVPTQKLRTFLDKNGIGRVDFMKMDVEGEEDWILRSFGDVHHLIDMMLIEFHYDTWPELVEILKGYGFMAYKFKTPAVVCLFTREKL